MATYVNYAERNAADQVDWSAIGTSISKTLLEERDRRENAKKEIADASNKYAETLANAPIGESKDFNQFTLDFADNAQEFRLMQDRMLRDGRMKLRDYNVARQNLTTGTKEAFNLANEYNAEYAKKMERFQNQKSQSLESFLMGTVEGFGNFNESSLYIDPNTGKVVAAKKEKKTSPDGTIIYEMSANPNDFSSIANLKNRIKSEYNKFNVSENLQSGVDDLGKRLEVIMQGGVRTREDAKQTPGFKEARDTYIDSFVNTNPDNVTSILTDYITQVVKDGKGTGQEFEFTFDKEQAASDEKYILLRENPQTGRVEGDFTTSNGKKQKEMAREALKSKFNTMIDVVETAMPIQRKTTYDQKSEEQTKIDRQGVEAWAGMYYGTPEEQKGFADRLLGSPNSRRQGLVEIDTITKPGTFILKYKDKTKNREIDVVNEEGTPISYADYIALGNEIHGIDDYGKALDLSGRKDATYTTERGGRSRREGSRKSYTAVDNKVNYRGTSVNADNIIEEYITEDVADEDTVKVIRDVFEVQDLPNPIIEINKGGEQIRAAKTRTTARGTPLIVKPAVIASPSLKISVPGVTATPIYIPEGDGMKDILDKAIALIDEAYSNNKQLTSADFKTIFPSEEKFFEYNQENTTEQTPATGDKVKKQLPGKKQ